jgi:hypothetical protein
MSRLRMLLTASVVAAAAATMMIVPTLAGTPKASVGL